MIELPWALAKVLEDKLTSDQYHDLIHYLVMVYDEGIDKGYESRSRETENAKDEAYEDGFQQGARETAEYWESRSDTDAAIAYDDGYSAGYTEGFEAGVDEL